MFIKSYSKINLTLKTNFKTRNGLHEIQTFYCWINLFDKINIKKNNNFKDKIIFNGPYAKLIKKNNNSVFKTLKKLRELKLISNYYSVIVTKNIPVFSGLGGGTSNAAFILKYLLKNKINKKLLNEFETLIGSDFKLFFKKQGFLKNLRSITHLKNPQRFYFTLIQPKIMCSTKEIYSKVKRISKKESFNKNLTKSKNKFLKYLSQSTNDLQFIVENKYPLMKKILIDIQNLRGCCFSRITGSGSVCYGLFMDQIVAKKALNKLKKKYPGFWISLAKTV